jgi:hypothetical protein
MNNELKQIKERNARVELDKKWETSITRRLVICVITYFCVVLFCYLMNFDGNIWLTSLVPVIGFFLSTVSLNLIRKLWEKSHRG